jgi:hypothetical protein
MLGVAALSPTYTRRGIQLMFTKFILFVITLFFCELSVAADLPQCEDNIRMASPRTTHKYPSYESVKDVLPGTTYLHAFVEGSVLLNFNVRPDGSVYGATVVESEAWSDRYQRSYPRFFDETMLKYITTVKYEGIENECNTSATFRFSFEEEDSIRTVKVPSVTYSCNQAESDSPCVPPDTASPGSDSE